MKNKFLPFLKLNKYGMARDGGNRNSSAGNSCDRSEFWGWRATGPQNYRINQQGQALVTLLFFVVLAITIISAAVAIVMANALSASRMQEGFSAYSIAESGAENALLRLDRNLNYTGETMTVDGGTATITATGTNPVTILSIGTANNAIKKIQVVVNINNGQLSIVSWKEVY